MGGTDRETCGRCAMTSVTEIAAEGKSDAERANDDPFADARIELSEDELRRVSPSAWLAGAKNRLDGFVQRLTYGR
ncbi:hypothetical protein [Halococcus qingdaonensis]|uniref:hypothetical protein n=1 Tax=Halococcus qingdaonensis TaxID=224402 RepID=UPI0021162BC4|nr:hypothetical protein [Halococcus qingdaonensis]